VTMLKERRGDALDAWLKRAKESHVVELKSFANGIYRDYAAVYAACSRPESNGVTEGHVNRLKFLKRQMFGRAHLDLLGHRFLRTPRAREAQCVGPRAQAQATTPHAEPARLTSEGAA